MIAAEGILTSRGGLVSHAAVVARGMGTPAVCGAQRARHRRRGRRVRRSNGDDRARGRRHLDQRHDRRGRGRRGAGRHARARRGPFETMLGWADELPPHEGAHQRRPSRTTRDVARRFGAEGIGLCRTEHMFLGDRLPARAAVHPRRRRRGGERRARRSSRSCSAADFEGIFEAMDGLPVTIRLLDPPLHEFLPDIEELLVKRRQGRARRRRAASSSPRAQLWREANPMLGTRGCRLGIIKPGLYRMQAQGDHRGRRSRASAPAATRTSRS